MRKKQKIYILVLLVLLLIAINYPFLDNALEDFFEDYEMGVVERIIDGDTVEINNESVRLLGINSPERGELFYQEAKEFLQVNILDKEVKLIFGKNKYDRYNRKLAYIYYNNKNICLESVKNGYSNFYFPSGKDQYYKKFKIAWEDCLENKINLCEYSNNICVECIDFNLNIKNQELLLYNACNYDCDFTDFSIKDEGRKKFIFEDFTLESNKEIIIKAGNKENSYNILYWDEDYIWTKTGDSLFLRDNKGKLIIFHTY